MGEYIESELSKSYLEIIDRKYPTKYASFCIYDDSYDLINPDKIFIEGNVFLYQKANGYFTDKSYCSRIIKNPTYGDILLLTDDMIKHRDDLDHHFLEDICIDKQTDVNTYQLSVYLGS